MYEGVNRPCLYSVHERSMKKNDTTNYLLEQLSSQAGTGMPDSPVTCFRWLDYALAAFCRVWFGDFQDAPPTICSKVQAPSCTRFALTHSLFHRRTQLVTCI
jgi:hypothetical protein